ncbi:hypothetical protein [Frondihabitans sp. VKM Ac-2883]|uniref:hypothetical protein n=1 Tax=Frondihabitans sp. VKM Ac-2883 TaxID=2783823 RepID=UPI00188A5192|nr:hypothetical protein [Frondihabitans sp. VKM Ac-2883]MBF4575288.1 hypothetical protein [Frondihabitans sp. VKM Ac-2883]
MRDAGKDQDPMGQLFSAENSEVVAPKKQRSPFLLLGFMLLFTVICAALGVIIIAGLWQGLYDLFSGLLRSISDSIREANGG